MRCSYNQLRLISFFSEKLCHFDEKLNFLPRIIGTFFKISFGEIKRSSKNPRIFSWLSTHLDRLLFLDYFYYLSITILTVPDLMFLFCASKVLSISCLCFPIIGYLSIMYIYRASDRDVNFLSVRTVRHAGRPQPMRALPLPTTCYRIF